MLRKEKDARICQAVKIKTKQTIQLEEINPVILAKQGKFKRYRDRVKRYNNKKKKMNERDIPK